MPQLDTAPPGGRRDRARRPVHRPGAAHGGRRVPGTVLIVTLWILVVLAGLVLVLARSMRVEAICSANRVALEQAAAAEQGAIQYVVASLDGLNGQVPAEADLLCSGVRVGPGAFWLLCPDRDEQRQLAYGLADEAGKINLNTATQETLAELPEMMADIPPAVIDWRDADSDLTAGGAESEYYLLLADPYECKNAPFETVEELLLVRLASRDLLFGEDANRNGLLDENENDADASQPPDNRDGHLDRGIFDLVTVYSREPNAAPDGSPRVNVNEAQSRELARVLAEAVSEERLPRILDRARRGRPFESTLDFYYRTGLTPEEFAVLAGQITTRGGRNYAGLLNVNTAAREALLCLPGLDESDVTALVSGRPADAAQSGDVAWVTKVLSQEKAVGIGPYITTRSYQFSADIVSVSGDGRAFKRCRIVVDATESPPRVVYRQDLTHLGWPLSPDIISLLRSGVPLEDVLGATRQEVQ